MNFLILRNNTTNAEASLRENLNIGKIRLIKLITLLLFSFATISFAQSPEELMQQGNKFYQDSRYESAIITYRKILSQGFESSSLYHNLGNAYFKNGQIGSAILFYEKGLKLSPGDEDLAYNLRIANLRTVDKITEVPKLFIVQWWDILVTSFSFSGWSIIVIIIYLIFLGGIAFYLLSRKFNLQRLGFITSSSTLAILIISVVVLIARYEHDSTADYGILTEQIYAAKVSPDIKSNDAFVIHEGIKFSVEDKVNDWVKIKLADGKIGWVEKRSFEQI
ncbi:MAG: tetratricopeptide repeat protein [Bacteroidota bacterium]